MSEAKQAAVARKLTRGRLALLIGIPAAALVIVFSGVADYAKVDALIAHRTELLAFVAANRALAVVIFAAVYIAGVALSVPGWGVLTVAAGFLFQPLLGTIAVVLSATIGGGILFLAARYAVGDFFRARAEPALRRLQAEFDKDSVSYLLALHLMPVFPFFLTTLAAAFLGMRFRTFIVATLFGLIPTTLVYATLGAGLGEAIAVGLDPLAAAREPTVIAGLVGLGLLALLPVLIKRLRGR